MSQYDELKRLAINCRTERCADEDEQARNERDFLLEVDPEEILALIAENERLSGECEGCPMQAAEELRIQVDQLKAEVAGLKTGYQAYERVNAELKAENEALRREREGKVLCDLELFETLRDAANTEAYERRQCMATYRPLRQENLDSVVKKCDDLLAAIGKGEQP